MLDGTEGRAASKEAERNFLAILMASEPQKVVPLTWGMNSDDFVEEPARWLVREIANNISKGYRYADLMPRASEQQKTYMREIKQRFVSDAHGAALRETILHNSKMRKAYMTLAKGIERIQHGEDPLDDLMGELSKLYMPRTASRVHDAGDMFNAALERLVAMNEGKIRQVLPLGIGSVDAALAIQPGQLVVLGGKTGSGKTALALNIAWANAFVRDIPVLYLNSEMEQSEIGLRIAAIAGDMMLGRLRVNPWQEDIERIRQMREEYGDAPSLITDPLGNMTSGDVIGLTKYHVAHNKVEVVIVDYVQRLRDWANRKDLSQWQAMMEITQALKTLAADHQIVVVCLAQLNSYGELAASKGMANDADLVVTLERCADDIRATAPDGKQQYGKVAEEGPPKTRGNQTHLLKVTKGRHIETGLEFPVRMEPHSLKFSEALDMSIQDEGEVEYNGR